MSWGVHIKIVLFQASNGKKEIANMKKDRTSHSDEGRYRKIEKRVRKSG